MKLLFKLLKVDLINTLTVNQFRSTKKYKARSVKPLVSSIIVLIISAALFVFYGVALAFASHASGNDDAIIRIAIGLATFSTLFMTFGRAYSTLFKGKDFELLSAMPIPTKTIVASKIISLIFVNYLYFICIFSSSFIVYLFFTGITFVKIIMGLIVLLLGPFFPTVVCVGLSFIFGSLTSKSRHKNILQTISSLIMFVVLFVGIYALEIGAASGGEQYYATLADSIDGIMKMYFMNNFASGAINGNILDLLYYVLISVVPFGLFIFLIEKNYVKLNTSGNGGYKNKNFKLEEELKKEKKNNKIGKLLTKEFKYFFSTSIYCMNVIVGPIMACVVAVGMYITINSTSGGTDLPHVLSTVILIFTTTMSVGMLPSTSCSISLEGKTFWIIKTAPIKTEKVFIAKVLMYFILCIPFELVATLIGLFLWKIRIIDAVFLFVIPMIGSLSMGMLALWVNTCKYRFDWTNPTQIVKQSADTLLSMLLSFLLDAILVVPGFILMNVMYSPIVMLVTSIAICALSATILFTNGKKRYEAIQY